MSRTRGALGFLLAGALAALAAVVFGRAGAESSRNAGANYGIATDPEAVVLRLKISGGMALGSGAVYTLTGDGGLVHERLHGQGRRERFELSPLEVDDLLRIAVEGGLIGLEWPTLEARLNKLPGPGTRGTDLPRVHLEIALEHFNDAGGTERGPLVSTFSCACIPSLLAYHYAAVPEVAALDRLVRAIQDRFYEPEGKR